MQQECPFGEPAEYTVGSAQTAYEEGYRTNVSIYSHAYDHTEGNVEELVCVENVTKNE